MVVLESEASVATRGVTPLAEFVSGAYLCDGTHMSQPQAPSMGMTMRLALERADLRPAQIDYVNAHATGTTLGDAEEAAGFLKGEHLVAGVLDRAAFLVGVDQ
jgi:3-oxoacyl-(acyl-carrier-protein) synthase